MLEFLSISIETWCFCLLSLKYPLFTHLLSSYYTVFFFPFQKNTLKALSMLVFLYFSHDPFHEPSPRRHNQSVLVQFTRDHTLINPFQKHWHHWSLPSLFTGFPRNHSFVTLLLPHLLNVFTWKHPRIQSWQLSVCTRSLHGLHSYALNTIHMLITPKFIQPSQIAPLKIQTHI